MIISWEMDGFNWFDFEKINPYLYEESGVYLIRHFGWGTNVIVIGKGIIRDEILKQRKNPKVISFKKCGGLFITWTVVSKESENGVVQHLINNYEPQLFPNIPKNTKPIPIKFPKFNFQEAHSRF